MDGILLIDKPVGWTSHDVVAKLRGILGRKAPQSGATAQPRGREASLRGEAVKVGHAGTLDPFATGLLVLGVGKGTKSLTALVGVDKEYETVIRLGATSDTFDKEGVIVPNDGAQEVSLKDIEQALDKFRGGYEQLAPLHSAKKIGGKKLYDLARAGKATEDMRPMKRVTINELRVTSYQWPNLGIHVKCGSGTYIRSLADDIGRALGVGGYCEELRRTKVGDFDVKDALPMEGLTQSSALGSLKTQ